MVPREPRFANYQFHTWQGWAGTTIFAAALWMFHRSHKDHGLHWSGPWELRKEHTLVTGAVYSRVRRPMYTAFWLWALAQAFLLPNWIAGPAGLVGFGTLFFFRIGPGEGNMRGDNGEAC